MPAVAKVIDMDPIGQKGECDSSLWI